MVAGLHKNGLAPEGGDQASDARALGQRPRKEAAILAKRPLRTRPETSESLGIMPRESGASSNHRVIGFAPIEVTWLLDRPLSRAMTFEALFLDGP